MSGNRTPELIRLEHVSANIQAKRLALYGTNGVNFIRVKVDSEGRLILSYITTGAYTISNNTPDRVFDPTSTTDAETRLVLATLIEDLQSKGILEV